MDSATVMTKAILPTDNDTNIILAKRSSIERGLFGGRLHVGDKFVTTTESNDVVKAVVTQILDDDEMPYPDVDFVVKTPHAQDPAFAEPTVRFHRFRNLVRV